MIKKRFRLNKKRTLLVDFNTDIMINTWNTKIETEKMITFTQVEKDKIGKGVVRSNHKETSINDIKTPVTFLFRYKESVEAVIRQLEFIKKELPKKNI